MLGLKVTSEASATVVTPALSTNFYRRHNDSDFIRLTLYFSKEKHVPNAQSAAFFIKKKNNNKKQNKILSKLLSEWQQCHRSH